MNCALFVHRRFMFCENLESCSWLTSSWFLETSLNLLLFCIIKHYNFLLNFVLTLKHQADNFNWIRLSMMIDCKNRKNIKSYRRTEKLIFDSIATVQSYLLLANNEIHFPRRGNKKCLADTSTVSVDLVVHKVISNIHDTDQINCRKSTAESRKKIRLAHHRTSSYRTNKF